MSSSGKKLEIAPRYFRALWIFIKNQRDCLEYVRTQDKDDAYPPWTAFVTGVAIFLSILALDAARSARHFDRVAFFAVVLCAALTFAVMFHLVARVFGGNATLRQATAGAEYTIGFLLPLVAALNYVVVSVLNLFPGIEWPIGYFKLDRVVPTAFNQVLITLAIGVMIAATAYAVYRAFTMLSGVEQLSGWKAVTAMVFAILPVIVLHRELEVYAIIFAGELKRLAAILGSTSE